MLDLIIIIFVVFCVVNGRSKGFLRVALELSSLIIAFLIASRLGSHVGGLLDSIFNISNRIMESLEFPLVDVTDEVSRVIGVIGYIVTFAIARFLLAILVRQTSLINHIPLIGGANRLLGGIFGFIKGYIIVLMAVWLLSFIAVDWAENLVEGSFLAPVLLNSFPSLYTKLNTLLSR